MIRLLFLVALVQDPSEVYQLLDEGKDEELRKFTADGLVEAIRRGRTLPPSKTGEEKRRIRDAFGRETDLYLVIPAKPNGILFVLHGAGGDGRQLRDRLYRKFAETEGLILACPTAQKEPPEALNEDSLPFINQRTPHWWSYRDGNFVFTALRDLKREFPIDESRVILSGYSMGGFGTWNLGLRYPDRFAAIVPMAGGLSRTEYLRRKGDSRFRRLLVNALHLPVYALHGDKDRVVPVTFDRMSRDELQRLGYAHIYVEVPGGSHLLEVGEEGDLMPPVQEWLRGKRREAHPRKVRHYALGETMPQSYWVRIDELASKSAEVTAEIHDGNCIEATASGVKRLTFFLDETRFDLSKPVEVVCNGKKIRYDRPESSVDVVLESWRSREDRGLLYRSKVTIELETDR